MECLHHWDIRRLSTLHGFEKILGGVVIDKPPNEYTTAISDTRKHLRLLYQRGYVHGDIRDTDIMVPRSDKMKFMMVNFEWARKNGEVRYPMNVNKGPKLAARECGG